MKDCCEEEIPLNFSRRQAAGRPKKAAGPATPRIPRIARLMALAIKFQEMVDVREVRDYAEIARLGYVTRARLTQIMNLLLLAPDIQEHLLALPSAGAVRETHLRDVAAIIDWFEQRRVFESLASPS